MATERKFQTGALTLEQVRLIHGALVAHGNEAAEDGEEQEASDAQALIDLFADDGAHLILLDE